MSNTEDTKTLFELAEELDVPLSKALKIFNFGVDRCAEARREVEKELEAENAD